MQVNKILDTDLLVDVPNKLAKKESLRCDLLNN